MLKLAFVALFGLVIAGCASDRTDGASSGASATTQPSNPGSDRKRPDGTTPPSRGY